MKSINFAAIVGMALSVVSMGCSAASEESATSTDEEVVVQKPFGSGAILPEPDLKKAILQAKAGNAEAAYRLYAHYSIGIGDGETGQKYFEQAVALEYPPALYAKAVHLWDGKKTDVREVYALLKRALELGQPDTAQLLPEVEAAFNATPKPPGPGK